jgi:hypothetical protein
MKYNTFENLKLCQKFEILVDDKRIYLVKSYGIALVIPIPKKFRIPSLAII